MEMWSGYWPDILESVHPLDRLQEKNFIIHLPLNLLDKKNPGIYNQAIMDFGATICKPQNPLCIDCVQSKNCQAFQKDWTNDLPCKTKSENPRKKGWFYYFIVSDRKRQILDSAKERKKISGKICYEFILVGNWENNTS